MMSAQQYLNSLDRGALGNDRSTVNNTAASLGLSLGGLGGNGVSMAGITNEAALGLAASASLLSRNDNNLGIDSASLLSRANNNTNTNNRIDLLNNLLGLYNKPGQDALALAAASQQRESQRRISSSLSALLQPPSLSPAPSSEFAAASQQRESQRRLSSLSALLQQPPGLNRAASAELTNNVQISLLNPLESIQASNDAANSNNKYTGQQGADSQLIADAYQRGKEEVFLSILKNSKKLNPSFDPNTSLDCLPPPLLTPTASADYPQTLHREDALALSPRRIAAACSNAPAPIQDSNYEAMVLQELGTASVERRKQNSAYFDASSLADPDPIALAVCPTRGGGVTEPFPERLHRLLKEVEENSQSDVVSFFAHGRAFAIHNREKFVKHIMPKYFNQSRLSSFQRQLNLYGFTRITNGADAGGYYHELFLQGRPALSIHMRRVGAPSTSNKQIEKTPNFYGMKPVKGGIKGETTA